MYNAQKDLDYINDQLDYYLYIVGLNPNDINFITIDQIIGKAREMTQAPIDEVESGKYNCANNQLYLFLKNQRIALIANIRRLWYMRQLAIGALENEV